MKIPSQFKSCSYSDITYLCKDGLFHLYDKEVSVSKGVKKKIKCIAIYRRQIRHLFDHLKTNLIVSDVPFASLCDASFSYYTKAFCGDKPPEELSIPPSTCCIQMKDGTVITSYMFPGSSLHLGNVREASNLWGVDGLIAFFRDATITFDNKDTEQ
jgi:hypothetical protein